MCGGCLAGAKLFRNCSFLHFSCEIWLEGNVKKFAGLSALYGLSSPKLLKNWNLPELKGSLFVFNFRSEWKFNFSCYCHLFFLHFCSLFPFSLHSLFGVALAICNYCLLSLVLMNHHHFTNEVIINYMQAFSFLDDWLY